MNNHDVLTILMESEMLGLTFWKIFFPDPKTLKFLRPGGQAEIIENLKIFDARFKVRNEQS